MIFVYYVALGYLAAGLIAGGLHHAAKLTSFAGIVRTHRILPSGIAMPVAILITIIEVAAGSAALVILFSTEVAAWASPLFVVCTVLGVAFAVYVRQLLRHPNGVTSCGCSSFAGPLTEASIVPALALTLVSLFGLVATATSSASALNPGFTLVLPLGWGITLALIVNLLPASMPAPAT